MTRSSLWISVRSVIVGLALAAMLLPSLQAATMTRAGADDRTWHFSAVNYTKHEAWITLYVSGSGHSWWISCTAWLKPYESKACLQQPTNGPYKFRAEVASNGPHTATIADKESGPFWKDGSQKQYRTPGSENDRLFLCEKPDIYWSFQPNCAR